MFEIATTPMATTVVISGDLDLASRDQFLEVAARLTSLRRSLLTIDMCDVRFMDSTGAAFLISLAETGQRRGWLTVLRGSSDAHRFVLDICGATHLFRFDTEHYCHHTASPA
ncbi:STAS domain-containing protein [Jonesia denitrificans]|jgi:anti-anti-sigma factor|uniref:Anti-sigma-factor antagonist n=1 Tax=Jonesia denitrificans (strain ATCC 14870 / DSM 20603 / BCRC 15368 / CIP 55.134 / JCM 11481 / NBRC 15587 / NCTC 10816 / Prevot 55134) TaxID=471856 RepID=C7R2Q8_JONDD|nr:STAS domain-containing protein [Jonesia denitrificans]ACV10049.1 anti-sigma-factor antagonist [Jonesia denitrificans DSM 20603]ASE08719.1 anti-sigma factor antagonist [Jonesia denitrificans]QXB43327.1 STAS domain-containing protein [Jonesia denitrificans]SQH22868.1 Anti-anti-sigma regulatory factor (antagonist of anti-sigma factor) [Jonesia denitrificans]